MYWVPGSCGQHERCTVSSLAQVIPKENTSTHQPCTVTLVASKVAERPFSISQCLVVRMQIFVKILTGKTIVVHVDASDTVDILFTEIQVKVEVLVLWTRLIAAGKQLEVGKIQRTLVFSWWEGCEAERHKCPLTWRQPEGKKRVLDSGLLVVQ